jgi:ComF family protein
MKLDFEILFDILFPLSDDERLIRAIDARTFISKYDPHEFGEGIISLSSFKDPYIRAAIHLVKFHAHKKSAELLCALLKRYMDSLPHEQYLIIPIPLSSQRERKRGHNQVHTIASPLADERYQLCTEVLFRRVHTPPQTSLKKHDRLINIKNAFLYKESGLLNGQHIIIVDDVTTTGATLKEARKTLKGCGAASIRAIALAH